jgi:hypothetical protein
MNKLTCTRTLAASALLGICAIGSITPIHAQGIGGTTPPTATPATLAGLGSLTQGGISDPVIQTPTQAQLDDHARRLDLAQSQRVGGQAPTVNSYNVAGNYNGLSRNVGTGNYAEPNTYAYRNYCGPGASQILISNWTTNVPSIDTLASQELTNPNSGTYLSNMVSPLNSDAGTGGFYVNGAASSQGTFNNWVAGDAYNSGRPAITALQTQGYYGGTIYLNGWSASFQHIITIHGFNFSNPISAGDNFYYTETAGTVAGTTAVGQNTIGANRMWALVSLNNGQIW